MAETITMTRKHNIDTLLMKGRGWKIHNPFSMMVRLLSVIQSWIALSACSCHRANLSSHSMVRFTNLLRSCMFSWTRACVIFLSSVGCRCDDDDGVRCIRRQPEWAMKQTSPTTNRSNVPPDAHRPSQCRWHSVLDIKRTMRNNT